MSEESKSFAGLSPLSPESGTPSGKASLSTFPLFSPVAKKERFEQPLPFSLHTEESDAKTSRAPSTLSPNASAHGYPSPGEFVFPVSSSRTQSIEPPRDDPLLSLTASDSKTSTSIASSSSRGISPHLNTQRPTLEDVPSLPLFDDEGLLEAPRRRHSLARGSMFPSLETLHRRLAITPGVSDAAVAGLDIKIVNSICDSALFVPSPAKRREMSDYQTFLLFQQIDGHLSSASGSPLSTLQGLNNSGGGVAGSLKTISSKGSPKHSEMNPPPLLPIVDAPKVVSNKSSPLAPHPIVYTAPSSPRGPPADDSEAVLPSSATPKDFLQLLTSVAEDDWATWVAKEHSTGKESGPAHTDDSVETTTTIPPLAHASDESATTASVKKEGGKARRGSRVPAPLLASPPSASSSATSKGFSRVRRRSQVVKPPSYMTPTTQSKRRMTLPPSFSPSAPSPQRKAKKRRGSRSKSPFLTEPAAIAVIQVSSGELVSVCSRESDDGRTTLESFHIASPHHEPEEEQLPQIRILKACESDGIMIAPPAVSHECSESAWHPPVVRKIAESTRRRDGTGRWVPIDAGASAAAEHTARRLEETPPVSSASTSRGVSPRTRSSAPPKPLSSLLVLPQDLHKDLMMATARWMKTNTAGDASLLSSGIEAHSGGETSHAQREMLAEQEQAQALHSILMADERLTRSTAPSSPHASYGTNASAGAGMGESEARKWSRGKDMRWRRFVGNRSKQQQQQQWIRKEEMNEEAYKATEFSRLSDASLRHTKAWTPNAGVVVRLRQRYMGK